MPDIETIRVIIPQNKVVKINVILPGQGIVPAGKVPPHYFFGGPASGALPDFPIFRPEVPDDLPFAAILTQPNVFTDVNTLPGLRIGTRLVTSDYTVTVIDFEILVDASSGPVNITLLAALGTGQLYRVKKIDNSSNPVNVLAQPGDLIDGQASVTFSDQYSDCTVVDADLAIWDRFVATGGILPSDIARLSLHNTFTNLNTFTGVQFATKVVSSDYALTTLDYEVLVDTSLGPVTISLPTSSGDGQFYHIKKIDTSTNLVTVAAAGSDLIDGSISLSLDIQWADCELLDGAAGYWDNIGGAESPLPGNIAYVDFPNVFTQVNTIVGLRIGSRTIISDYILTAADYEILADASGGPINVALPNALGSGQIFRVKKIDNSSNPVNFNAQSGDLIDGNASVVLANEFDGASVIDGAINDWDLVVAPISPFTLPSFVARRDQANIFVDLNTFTGIRLSTKIVATDYTLTPLDFEVLADASLGPITVTLPPSTGSGQYYRVKKIDSTTNVVTVAAVGSDLIDGSISLNFTDQYADCQLLDASVGYWDNTGSAAGGGGGADFGANGRVVDLDPIRGFSFEVFDGTNWIEQVRYTEPSTSPPPTAEVSYWYRPEINDLTALKAWPTVGNLLNSRIDVLFPGLTVFILKSGPAAGGDPGQVAPDDYNVSTNDVHWLQAQ